jgi:ATP-dependent protease Clp ATPase subunit
MSNPRLDQFGLIPELVGVAQSLPPWPNSLERAGAKGLTEPKNAVVKQFRQLLSVDLEIRPSARKTASLVKRSLAKLVHLRLFDSGQSLIDTMFDLPACRQVVVDERRSKQARLCWSTAKPQESLNYKVQAGACNGKPGLRCCLKGNVAAFCLQKV